MTDKLLATLVTLEDIAVSEWLERYKNQLSLKLVQEGKNKAEEWGYGNKLDSALHLLNRMALVTNKLGDPLAEALVWRGRANILQFHERYMDSLVASSKAAALYEQYGTSFDVAVARTVEVPALGALERFGEAIELGFWIRPHFVRHNFTLGLARLAANLAQVYTWSWRLKEALSEYHQAHSLYRQLQRPFEVTWVLHNMGVLANRMDRLNLARRYYTRALAGATTIGDTVMTVKSHFNLARIGLRQGQYEIALEHLGQSRTHLTQLPYSPDNGYVNLFEAQIRQQLHQPIQAETLLRQALAHFEGLGRQLETAETLMHLGHLLAITATPEKLAQGLACLEQAEACLKHLDIPLFAAWLRLEQAELLFRLTRTEEAAIRAEQVLPTFNQANLTLRQAQAKALLADCRWCSQPEQAQQLYLDVLGMTGDTISLLAIRCWRGLGQMALSVGDVQAAEQACIQAVTQLETMRCSLRNHIYQAGFLEDKQAITEDLLAALHAQPGRQADLLTWVERFKASALADLLVEQPPDYSVNETLRDLLKTREQLAIKLDQQFTPLRIDETIQIATTSQRGATLAAHDSYQTEVLFNIRQQLQTTEEQIARKRDPTYSWREGKAIEAHQIYNLIDEQTAMISYYTVNGQLYALTATHVMGDLHIHPLRISLQEIEKQWQLVRQLVVRLNSPITTVRSRLSYLWQKLIAPLETRLLHKTRLLILPHRGLFHIPFAGLYDLRSQSYLIERWAIQLAPSATVLSWCKQWPQNTRHALLVGYPGEIGQVDYLPGVQEELETLSALLLGSTRLFGPEATLPQVVECMPGNGLIHLAGHAFYNSASPLESGMPLANGRWLRAADLYLRYGYLGGATVVLSGCETGLGRPTGGDILGLTTAFLYAGAAGVVAGLWRVDDIVTALLMSYFYQGLTLGIKTAEALQQAQLTLLHSEQFTSPYFWSPFVLSGDSRQVQ